MLSDSANLVYWTKAKLGHWLVKQGKRNERELKN